MDSSVGRGGVEAVEWLGIPVGIKISEKESEEREREVFFCHLWPSQPMHKS